MIDLVFLIAVALYETAGVLGIVHAARTDVLRGEGFFVAVIVVFCLINPTGYWGGTWMADREIRKIWGDQP